MALKRCAFVSGATLELDQIKEIMEVDHQWNS